MSDMLKKTPWHLWVVGVIALLWNGYGAFDYIQTTTQGEDYMRASKMTEPMIAYFNAMPTWMYVPWTMGVWGGVAGSILLLLRNKLAVPAFAISLLGVVVTRVYGVMNPMPPLPPEMAMMGYMPWVILVVSIFLLWYAWTQKKAGVLR